MQTATSPPPIGPAQKKGRCVTGETRKGQEDAAPPSLRLWDDAGQEPPAPNPQELRFTFADLRWECGRLAGVAKAAAEESGRFARLCTAATALALALHAGSATQASIASRLFPDATAGSPASELIDAVLRDLVDRRLLKPRVRQIGAPLYWVARDALACLMELRRIKQRIGRHGAEQPEEGEDDA
jgi:hypothetical protein